MREIVFVPRSILCEFLGRDEILAQAQPYPCVYLFDDTRSGFSAAIRRHQEGDYSHCAMGLGFGLPGFPRIVDQVATLRLSLLEDYLVSEYRAKCVELLPGRGDLSGVPLWQAFQGRVVDAQAEAERVLALPWWRRLYDAAGVLGRGLHLPGWFGQPGAWWCSEAVGHFARPIMSDADGILGEHPTPAGLNVWLKYLIEQGRARVAWRYDPDVEA